MLFRSNAKALVESAYKSGVILADSDSYSQPFLTGQFANPVNQNLVASGRDDFLPSDVYVNQLKTNNDPRLSKYFTTDPKGGYTGGPYGSLAAYNNYSHITPTITGATVPGLIYDPVYVKFMLAEAAARGFTVGKSAAEWYNDAVTSSMTQWGVSAADAATYLAAHPYDAANWKMSIGMEAWVAMYNRGFEAWYFFRRLDYPKLKAPGVADGLVYRLTYSNNEYSTNKTNVEAAASAIGGDRYTTKVFWDKF